jgi:hypothetical protein
MKQNSFSFYFIENIKTIILTDIFGNEKILSFSVNNHATMT